MEPNIIQGGIVITLVNLAVMLAWSQRDKIGAVLKGRVNAHTDKKRMETDLEQRAWERVLANGDYAKALVDRMFRQSENHYAIAIEQARTTEKLASQSVEVMQDFADIARGQGQRLNKIDATLAGLDSTMQGIGFIWAKLYFGKQDKTFEDLIQEVTDDKEGI